MFKHRKSYALPHLSHSERTGLHVGLQLKHVLEMLPAMLSLSLVLCVVIVKGLEVRVGNGFKGKSGGVFVGARSTLLFKFMAFISVDKFPDCPPAPSSCMCTHDTCMWTSHSRIPSGPPSQGVHRPACPILPSPSAMGCCSADVSFQQHSRSLP